MAPGRPAPDAAHPIWKLTLTHRPNIPPRPGGARATGAAIPEPAEDIILQSGTPKMLYQMPRWHDLGSPERGEQPENQAASRDNFSKLRGEGKTSRRKGERTMVGAEQSSKENS